MKIIYNTLNICLLFVSLQVAAISLDFSLNGNTITSNSLMPSNGRLVPSAWEVVSGLSATNHWIPSTHSNQPQSIILRGPSANDIVTFPLKVVGLEYNMGSIAQTSRQISGTCIIHSSSNNTVAVVGASDCSAPREYRINSSAVPFYFIRPILELNNTDAVNAFRDKPQGIYTGVVPMVARYTYYTVSGALTYRNINYNLSVSVNYRPANLVSVEVITNGVMEPIYNKETNKVTANYDHRIIARGYLPTGVNLRFPNRSYELKNLNSTSTIPYSFGCNLCTPYTQVVMDGVRQFESSTARNPNLTDRVDIRFNFEYEAERKDVESGLYADSFTVIFEANI